MEIQQLQTSLQKEIDAKQRIHEELKECQAENILKAEYVYNYFDSLDSMNFFDFNRENLRLKEEIEKLQKQLVYEQSKQLTKSPVVHSVSGKID